MSVLIHQPLLLLIAGGVFVAEALSVMLQVSWFQFTRRRYGEGRRIFACPRSIITSARRGGRSPRSSCGSTSLPSCAR